MHLRIKFEDGSIIIYREKWRTIATQLVIGLLCILIATVFYALGATKAPTIFLIVFCGMFSIGGAAILISLLHQTRQILANDGAIILVANTSGITLTPDLGGKSLYNRWGMVCEVILTERFNLIYPDGEQDSYFYQKMIVVFNANAHKSGHWLNEFGTGITKSGEGRAYLLCDYPKNSHEMIHRTLASIVPKKLRIRICTKVEFNRKSREDRYTEA